MLRAFCQVDVFGQAAFSGNPVAVVMDGDGLTMREMVQFTRWTNLCEATFLLPPTKAGADYRVCIITGASGTPARGQESAELPFAGHPTLGTCHAWLESGGQPKRPDLIIQQCGAGLVPIRRTDNGLAFAAPALRRSGPAEGPLVDHIAGVLGIHRRDIVDAAWVDNGPGWVAAMLPTAEHVLALRPRGVDLDLGVVGPYPADCPEAFEVRAFFPRQGTTVEDPVTGSLNASLAQWLLATGRASAPYIARQGTALGREGRVYITRDSDGTIWVGGRTITHISGVAHL